MNTNETKKNPIVYISALVFLFTVGGTVLIISRALHLNLFQTGIFLVVTFQLVSIISRELIRKME